MTVPATRRCHELDERTVEALVREVNERLSEVGEALGLDVRVRKSTWSRNNAELTVEAARVDERGVVMGRAAERFLERAHEFGLQPSDLGRELGGATVRFRVVGLRPRAKAAILCESLWPEKGQLIALEPIVVLGAFEQLERERAQVRAPLTDVARDIAGSPRTAEE